MYDIKVFVGRWKSKNSIRQIMTQHQCLLNQKHPAWHPLEGDLGARRSIWLVCFFFNSSHVSGADPGFFSGRGALVSCSTSTPINHIVFFFFCRIPVGLENRRSSQGVGAHPLHPPPRSAPACCSRGRMPFVLS